MDPAMIDWTLNIGTIVQIGVIACGGIAFLITMRGKLSLVESSIEGIKDDLKELRKVITTQVDHDGRLRRAEDDIHDLRKDMKELRHGEGFVFPLKPVG
jgi:hypothetical protein